MSRRLRSVVTGSVAAAVVCLTAASCSSAPDSSTAPIGVPKNIDHWALPLDAYHDDRGGNETYAENILVSACLESRGIPWPIGFQPERPDGNDTMARNGRTIFSVSIARKMGYHQARTVDLPGYEKAREVQDSAPELRDEDQEDFTECLEAARKKMGTQDLLPQLSQELAFEPYDEAMASKPVKAAAKRWVACKKPLGISDLGSKPTDMPSIALSKQFGLDGDGDAWSTPRADEIDIAVKDATCRTTSGWFQACYDGEYNRQLPIVAKHADELNRHRAQIKERQKRVHRVIAENAPAK